MNAKDWALLGGRAEFDPAPSHGRHALPPWPRFEAEMRALFDRQWYTNQGPLARRLEAELAQRLGRRHVVCVSNEMIAAIMAAECLDRRGGAWISALAPAHVVQALVWAGFEPRGVDVDAEGEVDWGAALAAPGVAPALVVDTDPFGRGGPMPEALRALAVPVLLDRSRAPSLALALGSAAMIVGSLQAEQAVNALEGGYVALDDDALAAKLRNIRSSYGAGAPVEVRKTSNGRMSEAQAAMGLMSLETLESRNDAAAARARRWQERLAAVPGLRCIGGGSTPTLVWAVDAAAYGLDARQLRRLLRAEGVDLRGYAGPDGDDCPRAAALARSLLRLPNSDAITIDEVDRAAALFAAAHRDASRIARAGSD